MNVRMKIFAVCQVIWAIALTGFSNPPENEVERQNGIEFASPDGIPLLLDLHLPKVENPPLILFIHGGGWKKGSRNNCKLAWAAKYGYAIASIEYRLSSEALFPAQIHDCKGALRWLRAHAEDYGYDAEKVVVAGTSAGGHLAALMGTSGNVAELEGATSGNAEQSSRVQGIIDYYGPSDFVLRSKSHPAKTEVPDGSVYKLLGGKASENLPAARTASPITHVSEDDPPLLMLHGAKDTTVLLEQSEVLRDAYAKLGLEVNLVVIPDARHGWKGQPSEERAAILNSLRRWLAK